jgi:hypothetical protein
MDWTTWHQGYHPTAETDQRAEMGCTFGQGLTAEVLETQETGSSMGQGEQVRRDHGIEICGTVQETPSATDRPQMRELRH